MHHQGSVTDEPSALTYIGFVTDSSQENLAFALEIDHRCAGLVGISGASAHQLGWFFYWTHPDVRGRGLASQAAATVADWALGHRSTPPHDGGFARLELGHRVTNPASGAVAEAAGFLQEGLERQKFLVNGQRVDVKTYGRLRTDPPSTLPPLPLHTD